MHYKILFVTVFTIASSPQK